MSFVADQIKTTTSAVAIVSIYMQKSSGVVRIYIQLRSDHHSRSLLIYQIGIKEIDGDGFPLFSGYSFFEVVFIMKRANIKIQLPKHTYVFQL